MDIQCFQSSITQCKKKKKKKGKKTKIFEPNIPSIFDSHFLTVLDRFGKILSILDLMTLTQLDPSSYSLLGYIVLERPDLIRRPRWLHIFLDRFGTKRYRTIYNYVWNYQICTWLRVLAREIDAECPFAQHTNTP